MRKTMLMMVAVTMVSELFAIQGTISTDAERVSGDIKWRGRDRKYVIQKGNVTKELEVESITSLNIAKPAGFDKAVQAVEAGQNAAAIPVLTKIVSDYRMLTWDQPAGRALAQAYLATDDAKKAYDVCESIVSDDKRAGYTGDLAPAYWQALLKLGKVEKLEGLLGKAASSGDRTSAAAALVLRGDIILAGANNAPDALRKALTDGYLRVVLMYQEADCARERREAILKAADCFDKLRLTARAEKLRAQAKRL